MNTASSVLVSLLLAQASPSEAAWKPVLFPYYARQAAAYEFFLDAGRNQRLTLRDPPLLTWTNAADDYMGGVYVWTYGGRPEVVGCIGSRQTAAGECIVFQELHSLSAAAIQPVTFGDDKRLWQPPAPGIELRDAEGAPPPADSERERLTQMRALAREFTGWMKQAGATTELRLLPQPIFRYAARQQDVADAALFALVCNGTDPDVLLMLESRKAGGRQKWQFALIRFNWCELWVHRKGQEVWRMPQSGMANNLPFISGRVTRTTLHAIRMAPPD